MRRIVLIATGLLAVAALAGAVGLPEGANAVETPSTESRTVTANGSGSVTSVPDTAQLSFGVESRAATARAALRANGAEMQKVIAALKAAGAKDVKTQGVSVGPVTRDGTTIEAWSATNTVSVTIAAAKAGALIDAGVAAGANQVYGPTLTASDATKLYRDALKAAVADARARAEVLATAAGGTLGRVLSLSEGGSVAMPLYEKAAAMDASTPIEPGTTETAASVTVTYELR